VKRIVCIGGGPAGLYSAILLKKALPRARIEVYERNRPDDTFGWGVVFSDRTMSNFAAADAASHAAIVDSFYHWDDIDVHIHGRVIRSGGHGFSGIERKRLLNILQERAAELGVEQTFEQEIRDEGAFADADLLIGADGVNSRTRREHAAAFEPNIDVRKCRYIWLGATQKFPAFTFAFERTQHGWFQIHAYQFSRDLSTVIVETREETWRACGLDQATAEDSIAFCESLFGKYLNGARLMSNAKHLRGSAWLNFQRVLCRRWFIDNIVLIGDAAHTAHFSIGSGTKLAMEDAIALSREVAHGGDVRASLRRYQEERELEALKLQSAARNRMEWFENVARYTHLEPIQFTYSLLTGSQRIGHENLKLRDAEFVQSVEARIAAEAGVETARPPMFLPFRLRDLTLANRIVVSPMAQYCAVDGAPGDWHLVHLGARATGGAGLVFTEMTCVSPNGRISPGCTGLWNETQRDAWRRITDFVHSHSQAKICLQLGHSGRKGSTQLGWEQADYPLPSGNWPLISASPLPYIEGVSQTPAEATQHDIESITQEFVRAARFGVEAGFDMIELHMAHGYLLASFLSPLTNRRTDAYGGPLENRLRFPLEVVRRVRAIMPDGMPLSVRLSASDWAQDGLSEADLIGIARALHAAGVDVIDVSSGQTVAWQKPVYGRMYQTPFSDLIRNTVGVPTIAVGNIYEADHVNSIIASGRADLCALARPHLANPSWTLAAAAEQHYHAQWWPPQYLSGKSQLERNVERAALLAANV
jgi:anthraniloyl-CoA monooxygenase